MARREEKNKARGISSGLVESSRRGGPVLPISIGHGIGSHSIYQDRNRLYDLFAQTGRGTASATQEVVRNLKRGAATTSYLDIGRTMSRLDTAGIGREQVSNAWSQAARSMPDSTIAEKISNAFVNATTPFEMLQTVREGLKGDSSYTRRAAGQFINNMSTISRSTRAGFDYSPSVVPAAQSPVTDPRIVSPTHGINISYLPAHGDMAMISSSLRGVETGEVVTLNREQASSEIINALKPRWGLFGPGTGLEGTYRAEMALDPDMMLGYNQEGQAVTAGPGATLRGAHVSGNELSLHIGRSEDTDYARMRVGLEGLGKFVADSEIDADIITGTQALQDPNKQLNQIFSAMEMYNRQNMTETDVESTTLRWLFNQKNVADAFRYEDIFEDAPGNYENAMRKTVELAKQMEYTPEQAGQIFGSLPITTEETDPDILRKRYGLERSWMDEIMKGQATGKLSVQLSNPAARGTGPEMAQLASLPADAYQNMMSRRTITDTAMAQRADELRRTLSSFVGAPDVPTLRMDEIGDQGGYVDLGDRLGMDKLYVPPAQYVGPDLGQSYDDFLAAAQGTDDDALQEAYNNLVGDVGAAHADLLANAPSITAGTASVTPIPSSIMKADTVGISQPTFDTMLEGMRAEDISPDLLDTMAADFEARRPVPGYIMPDVASGRPATPVSIMQAPDLTGIGMATTPSDMQLGEEPTVALGHPQYESETMVVSDGISVDRPSTIQNLTMGVGRIRPEEIPDYLSVVGDQTARRTALMAASMENELMRTGISTGQGSQALGMDFGESLSIATSESFPQSNLQGEGPGMVRADMRSGTMSTMTPEGIQQPSQAIGQPTPPNILVPEAPRIDTTSDYMSAHVNVSGRSRYKLDPNKLSSSLQAALGNRSRVNTRVYDNRSSLTPQRIADILNR